MTTIQTNIANAGLPQSAAQGAHDHPPVNGSPAPSDTTTKDTHDKPVDVVELSPQAIEAAATEPDQPNAENEQPASQDTADADDQKQEQPEPKSTTGQELTEEEQEQVQDLQARDQEVRRHEAAHKAAAGQFASGGPTYDLQRGPDGKQYAVGGEVQIDYQFDRWRPRCDDPKDGNDPPGGISTGRTLQPGPLRRCRSLSKSPKGTPGTTPTKYPGNNPLITISRSRSYRRNRPDRRA